MTHNQSVGIIVKHSKFCTPEDGLRSVSRLVSHQPSGYVSTMGKRVKRQKARAVLSTRGHRSRGPKVAVQSFSLLQIRSLLKKLTRHWDGYHRAHVPDTACHFTWCCAPDAEFLHIIREFNIRRQSVTFIVSFLIISRCFLAFYLSGHK